MNGVTSLTEKVNRKPLTLGAVVSSRIRTRICSVYLSCCHPETSVSDIKAILMRKKTGQLPMLNK